MTTITIGKHFLVNLLIKAIGMIMIVQGVKTQSVPLAVFGFIIGMIYVS